MIRINLLAIERERAARRPTFQLAQRVTVLCSLILVATGLFLAWWYWSIRKQTIKLDDDIRAAQAESVRLGQIIRQVQDFEQRRTQLQQRVALIEELRRGQAAPVHLLDEISRALPEGLWLTELREDDASAVVLTGRCLALTGPSDFAANLEASGYFKKPVDILETQAEGADANQPALIRFSIKAQFAPPAG